MKGIIMAGGEGTRLRPLTCDCPKPMIRLMDRSVMQWTIELMKRHGIGEIAATLGYQPDAVADYFGCGDDFGVDLSYFIEPSPLGTAGGVKQASGFLDERFIVLSGDGVTDLDLTFPYDFRFCILTKRILYYLIYAIRHLLVRRICDLISFFRNFSLCDNKFFRLHIISQYTHPRHRHDHSDSTKCSQSFLPNALHLNTSLILLSTLCSHAKLGNHHRTLANFPCE